jgi:alkylhydroperoxidase family enzyme
MHRYPPPTARDERVVRLHVDVPLRVHDAGRVSRRGVATDRLGRLREAAARLVETVVDGEGATSVEARRAAFAGHVDDLAVAHYVDLVRRHAYRVTDEDIERLRGAGLDDDAIFELTVAAAVGAGAKRLEVGLSLVCRQL